MDGKRRADEARVKWGEGEGDGLVRDWRYDCLETRISSVPNIHIEYTGLSLTFHWSKLPVSLAENQVVFDVSVQQRLFH